MSDSFEYQPQTDWGVAAYYGSLKSNDGPNITEEQHRTYSQTFDFLNSLTDTGSVSMKHNEDPYFLELRDRMLAKTKSGGVRRVGDVRG